jgi:NADH-quinone oxidoreductase subunit M
MILPWLVLVPVIGGLLCWRGAVWGGSVPRWIALVSMALVVGMVLYLWLAGDYSLSHLAPGAAPAWQYEFRAPWIPSFGISLHLGVDGLSIVMLLMASGLGLAAVVCSWTEVQHNPGVFYLNLLWNLAGSIGVFMALDLFLFYSLWEMMLVPLYFLIALWGQNAPTGRGRIYAANQFFIFAQASGLMLLFSVISLVVIHYHETGLLSFDYDVLKTTQLSWEAEWLLMLGFFIPFAVKLPVVPLHGWLADTHAHAPTAGSVDIAGILIKTAAFGMLRFALPLFPHASREFAPVATVIGLVAIYYGAVLACSQFDVKRLVAYINISSMGFVLIAIYSGSVMAMQGAILQMLAHALSAAALFILWGELYRRLRTRDLRRMGGLWSRIEVLPGLALFFVAASLGLPATGNFIGEFLILLGVYRTDPITAVIAAGGGVLALVYSLRLFQLAFFGSGPAGGDTSSLAGPQVRELTLIGSLAIALLVLGLYPQPALNLTRGSVIAVQRTVTPDMGAQASDAVRAP